MLRVGVVGLGMGRGHIRGYRSNPGCTVCAIADIDAQKLHGIGDGERVEARYENAEEMIDREKPDIVSIATPNKFHKPLTIYALEHGCHVLCEKPMAMNADEGAEMLDTAKRTGKRLMINFSFRFTAASMALKAEVDDGALGDVYYGRTVWHRRRGIPKLGGWFQQKELSGGGPLIDLGVHRLDLALWLMGYPTPEWVMGSTYDHLGTKIARDADAKYDVEDLAVGLIRFTNGATLEIEASWVTHIGEKELMSTRLLGTRGGLIQKNVDGGYGFEAEMYTEKNGSLHDIKFVPVPVSDRPLSAMAHFVDAILQDREHIATGAEGVLVMKILDGIYRSAEEKQPVRIG